MMYSKTDIKKTAVYSLVHFLVDLACIILLTVIIIPQLDSQSGWLLCALLYNGFAFAFQLPVGAAADRIKRNAALSSAGCIIIVAGYLTAILSHGMAGCLLSCIIAGTGNAFFHVGGGIDVLSMSRRAALPGIYVSTGAFGLYLASIIYRHSLMSQMQALASALLTMAAGAALMMVFCRDRDTGKVAAAPADQAAATSSLSTQSESLNIKKTSNFFIICLCLILTVCVRSYAGAVISYEWKKDFLLGFLFVAGIVLGKALGGLAGDRFGWARTGTISLLLSAFLFAAGRAVPAAGILAIFLFNMTMPLTLSALADMMPDHKGLAFGMTTFALFVGLLPSLCSALGWVFDSIWFTVIVIISAAVFYAGMHIYERNR